MQLYNETQPHCFQPRAFVDVPADSSADFAIRMFSSDMEPAYPKGSILYIERTCDVNDGDTVVVIIGENLLCRRIHEDAFGNLYFIGGPSVTDNVLMVRRSDADSVICVGRVIGINKPDK